MALTNFVVTVVALGAVCLAAKTDLRQSIGVLRRNGSQIRTWLEQGKGSSKTLQKAPKEVESQGHTKDFPKEDKQ